MRARVGACVRVCVCVLVGGGGVWGTGYLHVKFNDAGDNCGRGELGDEPYQAQSSDRRPHRSRVQHAHSRSAEAAHPSSSSLEAVGRSLCQFAKGDAVLCHQNRSVRRVGEGAGSSELQTRSSPRHGRRASPRMEEDRCEL